MDFKLKEIAMLKINRTDSVLERLPEMSLAQANILERSDLQKMIVNDPEPFFREMGEGLILIGQEIRPSDFINDQMDLLAIDEHGTPVVIELKRAEHKLQLLQALSYAAMLSDWDSDQFISERSRFASETVQDARDTIADHLSSAELKQINQSQRVILIAENFDYALLKTAEWLNERYDLGIQCFRLNCAKDDADEYLSCTCIYPPAEIVDQASRARRPRTALAQDQGFSSWDEVLQNVVNSCVKSFFQKELEANVEERLNTRELFYRINGQRRAGACVRRKHAWAWQRGRFEGDIDYWKSKLSEPERLRVFDQGRRLSFDLVTDDDFEAFSESISNKLNAVELVDVDPDEDGAAQELEEQ